MKRMARGEKISSSRVEETALLMSGAVRMDRSCHCKLAWLRPHEHTGVFMLQCPPSGKILPQYGLCLATESRLYLQDARFENPTRVINIQVLLIAA